MKSREMLATVIGAVFVFTGGLIAGEREDGLIDKIVDAYGGDALLSIKTLKLETQYKTASVGQSASPALLDFGLLKDRIVIDFDGERSSEITWTLNNNGPRLGERFNNGETGHSINYMRGTHVDRQDYTFYNVAGGNMRMSDAALVRVLHGARDTATYGGEILLKGRPHFTLTYSMPESSDLTIFVDAETNFISKMTRPGGLSYVYSQHRRQDGISYAASTDFFINGQPNLIALSRRVTINPDVNGEFDMPDGIETIPGGMLDTSKMMVKKVAEGVFLAGQRIGFSLFVDAGEYFIGVGGYPQLTKRFDAVKDFSGLNKPLGLQVVTHHHSDHLAGLDEALALGAKLVTVESHVGAIRQSLAIAVKPSDLILVEGKKALENGRVEIVDIATSHSDQFLLFYVPGAKLIFSADHFSTQVRNALPGPSYGAVTFLNALEALQLDVDHLYDAHTPHVFTLDDLRTVAGKYTGELCMPGHAICAE